MSLDADDDVEESRRWIERAERVRGALDESLVRYLCEQHRARLALQDGDLRLSVRHIANVKRLESGRSNPRRAAYSCALDLGVAILEESREKLDLFLPDAKARFNRLRGSLGQDYLASQIITALRFCGRSSEARDLFSNYLRFRREQSTIPDFLSRLAVTSKS
jgi:hypothetical protein